MSALPFAAVATGTCGPMFAVEGMALNGYALWAAYNFAQVHNNTCSEMAELSVCVCVCGGAVV